MRRTTLLRRKLNGSPSNQGSGRLHSAQPTTFFNSLISGLPGLFEHVPECAPSPSNAQDWWAERIAVTGKAMEPVDNYSLWIFHTILKPRRIRGGGILENTVRLLPTMISVRRFVSRVSSLGRESVTGEEFTFTDWIHSLDTAACFETQEVFNEYKKLDAELEQWRASVLQELAPENAEYTVARTDPGHPEEYQDPNVDPVTTIGQDSSGESRLLDDQQLEACLNKCINAADEIMAIAEKFTDDDIKYRGFAYSFSVFTAGTVTGIAKDKTSSCHRFLETLGRHWTGAIDQNYLLQRLSSGATTQGQSGSGSPSINLLSGVIMPNSAPDTLKDAEGDIFTMSGKERQQKASVESETWSTTSTADDFSSYLVEEVTPIEPTPQQYVKPTSTWLPSSSRASGREQRPSSSESEDNDDDEEIKHAFLSTGSGLGTLWMNPI
ncbi:hypothetical protein BGZ96_001302 [Linnemannia gamsii]|uniref:Uncharacterized protein n=1 Tax=Linnemannia gamsii TaxID=64522 RepID=A0ABQ7KAR0_9FUNG|nr:hypothetical protein BGZ96_001302 [Linnemannia gamsii]